MRKIAEVSASGLWVLVMYMPDIHLVMYRPDIRLVMYSSDIHPHRTSDDPEFRTP
jgi:hypothetical protein